VAVATTISDADVTASVAVTVKPNVPVFVGVPVSTPGGRDVNIAFQGFAFVGVASAVAVPSTKNPD
jgi:flavoprotein